MQVKVCGITNVEDALMAAELGVNYLGYIVNHTASPRYITPTAAAHIIRKIHKVYPHVRHVAVLVDPTTEECEELIQQLDVNVVQFHGSETPEFIQSMPYVKKWKALEIHSPDDLAAIDAYQPVVDGILLDAGKGSGEVITAELLQHLNIASTFILAGGIGPDTIAERLQVCTPHIIDVNSGVEREPGKKDREKIMACLNILNAV